MSCSTAPASELVFKYDNIAFVDGPRFALKPLRVGGLSPGEGVAFLLPVKGEERKREAKDGLECFAGRVNDTGSFSAPSPRSCRGSSLRSSCESSSRLSSSEALSGVGGVRDDEASAGAFGECADDELDIELVH